MQNIQSVFNRVQKAKNKQKDIKNAYNDALAADPHYQEIKEKMKTLREKKKQIENTIKNQFASEFIKLEDLKIDIESDSELLSDITFSSMMKGESVELKDQFGNNYEPRFKVTFKKVI